MGERLDPVPPPADIRPRMLRCRGNCDMTARVVVVHGTPEYLDQAVAALGRAGFESAAFSDPILALEALEDAQGLEVLVTRIEFAKGKLNGVALARMARIKRSRIKVLFTALPEFERHTEGLGMFMVAPVPISDIVTAVSRLLGGHEIERAG